MELKVEEIKALAPVQFNYEELKANLTERIKDYKNLVYTEENIKEAKADRALLNKLNKALNNEKIRVKNVLLEPYADFEKKCKELMSIVDEAITNVDSQVKAYEQNIKDEKLKEIMNFFIENVGEYEELIEFDSLFNERWLNATYKMDTIQKEILHTFTKTKTDLEVIDKQFTDENVNQTVKREYFKNISDINVLTLAIIEGNKMIENNKKLEDLKQKQEVAKNETKVTKNTEIITNNPQNITKSEKIKQIDFRVWVTKEQMMKLREFLIQNNIEYGSVK